MSCSLSSLNLSGSGSGFLPDRLGKTELISPVGLTEPVRAAVDMAPEEKSENVFSCQWIAAVPFWAVCGPILTWQLRRRTVYWGKKRQISTQSKAHIEKLQSL